MSYYWDENAMKAAGVYPTILAIGDSWFWYPFVGGSLTNTLGNIVDSKTNVILAKGMNGAEAFDYVDGKYANQIRESLRLYGSGLKAVFISGGGNDFAGFNDLRPLLKADCSNSTNAKNCFRAGVEGLKGFLDRVDDYYRRLIGIVYTRTTLDCVIVMHSYDYAIPNGRGVFGGPGWLKPALSDARVPVELHADCIKLILDSFHETLTKIVEMDPSHLSVVDSRGTLSPGDWANELHPKGSGFEKIANTNWKPALRSLGLA